MRPQALCRETLCSSLSLGPGISRGPWGQVKHRGALGHVLSRHPYAPCCVKEPGGPSLLAAGRVSEDALDRLQLPSQRTCTRNRATEP